MFTRNAPPAIANGSMAHLALDHKLLKDKVAELLRDAIKAGDIQLGTKLVERELAAHFGVSKAPVRDALMMLEGEGIVVTKSDARYVAVLTEDDVLKLNAVRRPLERLAVQLACQNPSAELRAELQHAEMAVRDAATRKDRRSYRKLDQELHRLIWRMADNPFLLEALSSVANRVWLIVPFGQEEPFSWDESMAEHKDLVQCIVARDVEGAIRAMDRNMARPFGHPTG
jgi:DNA-binding GntR family transcriptional regulator